MARVRIKDIAQQAGVSPATVSRYLNNTPGAMTDQTRERIAEVIARTGYKPLAAARSLRTDRSGLLGIVLADISNPYSSAMIEALSAQAAKSGYTLMTAVSSNDSAAEASAAERLRAAGADALIVNTCGGNAELLSQINETTPVLLLDREAEGCELDLVTSNNEELMRALIDELEGCGCKRLVLFTEKDHSSSVRRERERCFLAHAREQGLEAKVLELSRDDTQAELLVCEALFGDEARADERPIGVVTVNGLVFFRLINAFQDARVQGQWGSPLDLGQDRGPALFAATFDEYAWNRLFMGGVTTAAQDVEAIATAVVERALARIDDQGLAPRRVEIDGTLIKRASTQRG